MLNSYAADQRPTVIVIILDVLPALAMGDNPYLGLILAESFASCACALPNTGQIYGFALQGFLSKLPGIQDLPGFLFLLAFCAILVTLAAKS